LGGNSCVCLPSHGGISTSCSPSGGSITGGCLYTSSPSRGIPSSPCLTLACA
jgi:hypothetical protein